MIPEDIQKLIIEKYLGGLSTAKIGIATGIGRRTISKFLKKSGICTRGSHSLFPEQEDEVVHRYLAGESTLVLAKVYCTTVGTIRNILIRHSVNRRGYSEYQILHPHFFHDIETEPAAYWLGFLSADSNIQQDRIVLTLQESDAPHLQRFLDALGSTHPIRHITVKKKYPTATIAIWNKPLVDDLKRAGVTARKSLTLQWPEISLNLHPHFIRGYVDGDGGFYKSSSIRSNFSFSVWSASISFLQTMQAVLVQSCELNQNPLYERKDKPDKSRLLSYSGRRQMARIFKYLYTDATIWLPRKRDKVESYLLDLL